MGRGGPCSRGGGRQLGNRSNSNSGESKSPSGGKRRGRAAGARCWLGVVIEFIGFQKMLSIAAFLERSIQKLIDRFQCFSNLKV